MFLCLFSPAFSKTWKTSKPTSGVLCLSGKGKEWCFSAGRPLTLEVSTTSSSFIFHLHLIFSRGEIFRQSLGTQLSNLRIM